MATSVYCSTVWTYAVMVRGVNPLEASLVVLIFLCVSEFVGMLVLDMARDLKRDDADRGDRGDRGGH